MEFISLFTKLLSEKTDASPATIKNYRADLNHFIKWFEKKEKTKYSPEKITSEILAKYQNTSKSANSSLKRRVAALKKFHALLSENNFSHNPFISQERNTSTPLIDLKDIENFLQRQNASPLTRKNYIADIKGYLKWVHQVTTPKSAEELLSPNLIKEYKERLRALHVPTSTINRRLSSLRKLHQYGQAASLVTASTYQTERVIDTPEPKKLSLAEIKKLQSAENEFSKFPPIRLFQRLLKPYFELEDKVATSIAIRFKKNEKKANLQAVPFKNGIVTNPKRLTANDVTRHLYAPITAPKNATLPLKVLHHAQHTRPKWYKRYHSFTASHYLHFSILIIGAIIAGFTLYQHTFTSTMQESVLGTSSSPKIMAFQGMLTDEKDIPITTPTNVSFTIYTSEFGNAPLWQESQSVSPDNTGEFTAYLGTITPINNQMFADNSQLYLGIRLDGQEELSPRQRLASVAYAANSEFLQGLAPITQAGAGAKNVVLALDSTGNLTIPGNGTHTFTSQEGTLKLSANSVILTSNTGTDGDIILAPDGNGGIDIQNSIKNTSENGTLWPGSVTIEDEAVVSATSSAKPAFALLQGGTGDIFTASTAGSTRFVIDNEGRVGINTDSPTEYLQINNGSIFLQGGGGRLYGDSLKVESTGTSPLLIQPNGSSAGNVGIGTDTPTAFTHIEGGSSSTPLLKLNFTGDGQNIINAQAAGTTVFVLGESGNIGIGTTTTSSRINLPTSTAASGGISFGDVNLYRSASGTLRTDDSLSISGDLTIESTTFLSDTQVNGTLTLDLEEAPTTNGVCHSGDASDTTASDRDLVTCSSAPADYAEWYAADNTVETGNIVELSSNILTYEAEGADAGTGQVKSLGEQDIAVLQKASRLDKVLGVVSTAPFQIIGADIKKALIDNPDYKAVPLALNGRVLLKIAHNSPEIEPGDPLTLSASVAGKATKAIEPTFIVARALEGWNKDKEAILVYIQPTWYQPLALTENGTPQIEGDTDSPYYTISGEEIFRNIATGAQLIAGRIEAGAIIAQQITVEATLTATEVIASRLKAGSVEAGEITTDALAITSDRLTIAGKSLQEYIDERVAQVQSTQLTQNIPENSPALPESELELQKTASISGNLTTESLSTQGSASDKTSSNSGTLEAQEQILDTIEELEENISSTSAQTASESADSTSDEPIFQKDVEVDSNNLALLPSFKSSFAIFEQDLSVYGPTTLNEATVLDDLTIGSGNMSLTIGSNNLNSLSTLEIQPLAQAPISFMGGKVVLDTQGNLTIGGDTYISGTLAAHDAIFEDGLLTTEIQTGIISPLPDNDLAVRLGKKEDGTSQKFEVQTASGAAVLSVDNNGNIEASGSATFAKLNFWDPEEAYAEVSDTEVETQGSAGKAAIKAYRRELTIHNSNVTENSLIYITPAGNTQDKVVYLLRQVPGESFTVGITTPATSNVEFNWLIVN